MDIDTLKSIIFDDIFANANNDCFILEPYEYANDITNLIMECEGPNNCHKHTEIFQGIDISNHLNDIKDKRIEYALILAITKKVEDKFIIIGDKDCIHAVKYFEKSNNSLNAIEFIAKWYCRGAKICNYHNHPLRVAAIPSDSDIKSFCSFDDTYYCTNGEWNECVKEYGIDLPARFRYSDWGVVTSFDFFSYKQFTDNGNTMDDLLQHNKNNQAKKDNTLSKYNLDCN